MGQNPYSLSYAYDEPLHERCFAELEGTGHHLWLGVVRSREWGCNFFLCLYHTVDKISSMYNRVFPYVFTCKLGLK